MYKTAHLAAQSLGLSTIRFVAPTPAELDGVFQSVILEKCSAILVLADPIRPGIVPLAARAKIPAVYQFNEFVKAGGLASYGPSLPTIFRRSAEYVDMIFKGTNPADLPVEQPSKFEMVLNLRTAAALGLSVPPLVLARAARGHDDSELGAS
jgi:putative tryptophan/tyrosine transport system substrate-binding protein